MQIDLMKALLRDAVTRYATLPFERFAALEIQHWLEEVGSPNADPRGNYCQIEVELLDRIVEGGVEVLHVPVIARDGYREFGTDLFVHRDGRIRWDRKLYEFVGGIARVIDDGA